MTVIDVQEVLGLFPELGGVQAVEDLLAEVSGLRIDAVPAPAADLDELLRLRELPPADPSQDPVGFDGYARQVCAPDKAELAAIFARAASTSAPTGPGAGQETALVESAWSVLVERVQQVAVRTLIATMHLLREADLLEGATSEERYRSYCALIAQPRFAQTIADVFPSLRIQVEHVRRGFVGAVRLLVARLDEMRADGRLSALVDDDLPLSALRWTDGDSHAGGQSVVVAEFGGGAVSAVYKPRPMDAEAALAELVRRFNEHAGTQLPTLAVVTGDGFGWQEHADAVRLPDAAAYYRRCGELLAVLHVVGATDMHYQNVLNHRGGPVVVDAETLFSVNHRRGAERPDPAQVVFAGLVSATGFLPSRLDGAPGGGSMDVGFLGYAPGQTAVTAGIVLRAAGTDQMYVDFERPTVEDPSVLPAATSLVDEPGRVADGFAAVYDWVLAHRDRVATWLRELFTGMPVRVLVENTRTYYQLLSLATHPQFHRSPELTEVLFHRCGIGRVAHVTAGVVRAEIDDLARRDVPYFTLRTDQTRIFDSRGTVVGDPLVRPPLEQALEELRGMTRLKRDLNTRAIRAAFVGRTSPDLDRPGWERGAGTSTPSARVDVDVVRDIAEEYLRLAIPGRPGEPTQWIGSTLSNTVEVDPWRFRALGDGLYAGSAGLALFLAAAAHRFGERRFADCAESYLLPTAAALLDDAATRRAKAAGGLGDGYAGTAYALVNGGRLTGRTDWEDAGLRLWAAVAEDLRQVKDRDVLLGSAGLLLASGRLLAGPGVPAAFRGPVEAVAAAAFEAVAAGTGPDAAAPGGDLVYSGFAHGLAGTLAAVSVHGRLDPRARDLAARLGEQFTAEFEQGPVTWPLSTRSRTERVHGWCHGSPGILLGELVRQEHGGQEHGGQDRGAVVERLVEVVTTECLDLNFTLCHGDLGNLVILQRAAALRGDRALADDVRGRLGRLGSGVVRRHLTERNAKTFLNDSLLCGLPGVGYGMLQLESGGGLPDVLAYGFAG